MPNNSTITPMMSAPQRVGSDFGDENCRANSQRNRISSAKQRRHKAP